MAPLPKIVHIVYSGAGGQAGVCFPLAHAARHDSEHCIAFYGVEPVADGNVRRCNELGLTWRAWQKGRGLSLAAQREMAAWIVSLAPVAVIAHSPAVVYACRRARKQLQGLRIIAVEHHCNALKSLRQWILSAVILRRADRVVYLTKTYRDEVKRKLGPFFRPGNTCVIPNGLDLTAYQPSRPAGAEFTVGMQGRMVEGKDFPTLVRAVALANAMPGPRIRLELAGDGPMRQEIEAIIAYLGISSDVTLTGMLAHRDLAARLAGWHAYAHASMGETMSIALMEAKACGLPIVASDVNGIRPFFEHGVNGLLVPPADPAALAAALRTLSSDPELCARFSAAGRREAEERYSITRTWQAYRNVIFPCLAPVSKITAGHSPALCPTNHSS